MENGQIPAENGKSAKRETISELARRHMQDENHTTSDEELKNAEFEVTDNVTVEDSLYEVDNTTIFPAMDSEKEENDNTDDEKNDEDDDRTSFPNPYSVLG